MKANHTPQSVNRFCRYDDPNRRGISQPHVEFNYQTPRPDRVTFGGGPPRPRRSNFSLLANEVLRSDASRSHPLEAALLAFVTLVSAWPMAVMIHEVVRLLR